MRRSTTACALLLFAIQSMHCQDIGHTSDDGSIDKDKCVLEDDGNPCTENRCENGTSIYVPKPNGVACILGGCTIGSVCQSGNCVAGTQKPCNGDAMCKAGACAAIACSGTVGLGIGEFYSTGQGVVAVAAADFNGDGKKDVAVGSAGIFGAHVLLNKGNGTFAPEFAVGEQIGSTQTIAADDFNGDGHVDLVVGDSTNFALGLLLNQGDGTFPSKVASFSISNPLALVTGDFDGDGAKDIASMGGSTLRVFLNQGQGIFGPSVEYPVPSGGNVAPEAIVAADLNGDGRLDLALATGASGVRVWLNQGNGQFGVSIEYPTASPPNALTAGDFNGDGNIDLASACPSSKSVNVLLNQGDGTFPTLVNTTFTTQIGTLVGLELTGDGVDDLAVVSAYEPTLTILRSKSDGTFALSPAQFVGQLPSGIAKADIDDDGRSDLVVTNFNGGATVLRNFGTGVFGAEKLDLHGGERPVDIAMADLNGDGHLDMAVTNYDDNNLSIFLNLGDGTFAPPVYHATGPSPQSVAAGDLNDDAMPDLVVVDDFGLNFFLNGGGAFGPAVKYEPEVLVQFVTTADVNGDALVDLIMAESTVETQNIIVVLNGGNGTFGAAKSYPAGNSPHEVAVVDVDVDGKPDLIVANADSVSVLHNQGGGTFGEKVDYPQAPYPAAISVVDLNADDKPDLVASNSNAVNVHLNQGDGTFSPPTPYVADKSIGVVGVGYRSIGTVDVGDLNGDGYPDICAAERDENFSMERVSVWLNRGDGSFAPKLDHLVNDGPMSTALVLADLNTDGRLDVAFARPYGISVAYNACFP